MTVLRYLVGGALLMVGAGVIALGAKCLPKGAKPEPKPPRVSLVFHGAHSLRLTPEQIVEAMKVRH